MKETKHINLAGCALIIDEDAADVLGRYLNQIENHLQASDSKEEIMQDIEARVAELLRQHLSYSHAEVANLRMVEDVMAQLGTPEAITDGEEAQNNTKEEDKKGQDVINAEAEEVPTDESKQKTFNEPMSTKKKLYRSVDSQKVAGVCSGVADYLGIDAIWLRLLLALSVLFYGCGIFLYLILWLVIPAANTTARKLEQQGVTPSAENIRQEVERQKEHQAEHPNEPRRSSGTGLAGGCLIALALILFFPLIALLLILLPAIFGITAIAIAPITGLFGISAGSLTAGMLLTLCGLMIFLIPLVVVLIWSNHRNKSDQPMSKWFWIIALLLWLLSIGGTIAGGCKVTKAADEWDTESFEQRMDSLGRALDAWGDSMDAWGDSLEQHIDSLANTGVLEVGE